VETRYHKKPLLCGGRGERKKQGFRKIKKLLNYSYPLGVVKKIMS
jgi:hypothetical protein